MCEEGNSNRTSHNTYKLIPKYQAGYRLAPVIVTASMYIKRAAGAVTAKLPLFFRNLVQQHCCIVMGGRNEANAGVAGVGGRNFAGNKSSSVWNGEQGAHYSVRKQRQQRRRTMYENEKGKDL